MLAVPLHWTPGHLRRLALQVRLSGRLSLVKWPLSGLLHDPSPRAHGPPSPCPVSWAITIFARDRTTRDASNLLRTKRRRLAMPVAWVDLLELCRSCQRRGREQALNAFELFRNE